MDPLALNDYADKYTEKLADMLTEAGKEFREGRPQEGHLKMVVACEYGLQLYMRSLMMNREGQELFEGTMNMLVDCDSSMERSLHIHYEINRMLNPRGEGME
jgi:hypothetical protein